MNRTDGTAQEEVIQNPSAGQRRGGCRLRQGCGSGGLHSRDHAAFSAQITLAGPLSSATPCSARLDPGHRWADPYHPAPPLLPARASLEGDRQVISTGVARADPRVGPTFIHLFATVVASSHKSVHRPGRKIRRRRMCPVPAGVGTSANPCRPEGTTAESTLTRSVHLPGSQRGNNRRGRPVRYGPRGQPLAFRTAYHSGAGQVSCHIHRRSDHVEDPVHSQDEGDTGRSVRP
jgi:hypothetical protein